MCGIAGVFRFDRQPADADLLQRMAQVQLHRGPDDEGVLFDGPAGLAFRRLSILDLSPAGHQPMASADGTCWLVFNGEIYNYLELRRELQQLGYTFHSQSDSEVILAAYQAWDVECLSRFNGMWGLAIWDQRKGRLFCARDRMGVKPFYYHHNERRLVFASEIKALFADAETPRAPDEQSAFEYLVVGRVHFDERTFFSEIKQLPGAHYLLVDRDGVRVHRYWSLDHGRYRPQATDKDAIECFRHLFFDSVRLRLQSDVPVGTCLSGGLDSSAIVCVANTILFGDSKPDRTVVGERQKTFSACYDNDPSVDERQWIEPVIAQTHAQPHYVFPDGEGLYADLDAMVWHHDEPTAGSSLYAQWCVMRRARQAGVVVMLDGQGGDEVMGGYQRYYWTYVAGLARAARVGELARALRQPWGTSAVARRVDWLGAAYAALPPALQESVRGRQRRGEARDWLGEALLDRHPTAQGRSAHPTWLGQALERDLVMDCLPSLLKYEDRNSMAHSIEARVPFLDYRLVEFMASMPDRMKIRDGRMKWLLREALKDVLPPEVSQRRSKIGFATPEHTWMRQHWAQVQKRLAGGHLARRGWVRPGSLERLTQTPDVLAGGDMHLVWRWLSAEIWLERFFTA